MKKKYKPPEISSGDLRVPIAFFELVDSGPEPGMGSSAKVFEAFAEIYEPSAKDVQLGNLELGKTNITVVVRSSYPEYIPKVNNTFEVMSGIYSNTVFDIKTVAPIDDHFIKIVGESSGS